MENKAFKIAGIKNLITRNYKLPSDVLNLEDLVDDGITMAENWNIIKPKVFALIPIQELYIYKGLV